MARLLMHRGGGGVRRFFAPLVIAIGQGCGATPAATTTPLPTVEQPAAVIEPPPPPPSMPTRELIVAERGECRLFGVGSEAIVECGAGLARIVGGALDRGDHLGDTFPQVNGQPAAIERLVGNWPDPIFLLGTRTSNQPGYSWDYALYRWNHARGSWRSLEWMGDAKTSFDIEPLGTDRWIGQRVPVALYREPALFILGPGDKATWLELGEPCIGPQSLGGHPSGHVYATCASMEGDVTWLQHWVPGARKATALPLDRSIGFIAARSPDDVVLGGWKGLLRFDGRSARHVEGGPTHEIRAMLHDGDDLWILERDDEERYGSLWRWPKEAAPAPVDVPASIVALHAARDGALWLATPDGLVRRATNGSLVLYRLAGSGRYDVHEVVPAAQGDAWATVTGDPPEGGYHILVHAQ